VAQDKDQWQTQNFGSANTKLSYKLLKNHHCDVRVATRSSNYKHTQNSRIQA
jgi:hypothetical protein